MEKGKKNDKEYDDKEEEKTGKRLRLKTGERPGERKHFSI